MKLPETGNIIIIKKTSYARNFMISWNDTFRQYFIVSININKLKVGHYTSKNEYKGVSTWISIQLSFFYDYYLYLNFYNFTGLNFMQTGS